MLPAHSVSQGRREGKRRVLLSWSGKKTVKEAQNNWGGVEGEDRCSGSKKGGKRGEGKNPCRPVRRGKGRVVARERGKGEVSIEEGGRK